MEIKYAKSTKTKRLLMVYSQCYINIARVTSWDNMNSNNESTIQDATLSLRRPRDAPNI